MNARITISLPGSLLVTLDRLTRQWNTSRSGALAELLRRAEREELERELQEGYVALAEANRCEAEVYFAAQAEVILDDRS